MSHFKCRKCGYVDSGYIHIFDPKEWMKDNENLKERFEKMGLHVLIQESPDQNEVSFDCHRLFSCHREKELTMAV